MALSAFSLGSVSCARIVFMPSAQLLCWSCVLVRGAHSANWAVDRPNKDLVAHALGLCRSCLDCRRCSCYDRGIRVDDMPLHLRTKCTSLHTPHCPTVSEKLPLCSVCNNLIAVPCTDCLDEAELGLRRSGVLRCVSCSDLDLVVKGEKLEVRGRWEDLFPS